MAKLGRAATARVSRCANPKCPATERAWIRIERHHIACDRMFARHLLAAHPHQLWVQLLSARYHEFVAADVVNLCVLCHQEIHQLYLPYIRAITYGTGRRVDQFSEMDVKTYKSHLARLCLRKLKTGFAVRSSIVKAYNKEAASRPSGPK